MGTKDSKAKEYLSDNTRFSEICNYVLFDGEKVIKPEDLKECDTTEVLSVFGIDKKQIVKQKWRDLLKGVSVKYTESVYIVLMGIEAQADVHYAMPVKTMIYDAMNYGEQVNEAKKQHQKNKDYKSSDEFLSGFTLEDRLTPVITITLYLGTTQWDGPRSLAEMMPQMDERILPFINDYSAAVRQSRMRDYYSMWVHQIKTPISAMKLLLEAEREELGQLMCDEEQSQCQTADMSGGNISADGLNDAAKQQAAFKELSDNLDSFEDELFRIEEYVSMALQYQRVSSTENDFVLEKISLDGVIRDTIKKYAKIMIRRHIGINYSGTKKQVYTDEKWLAFILEQILSNAIKYTQQGVVTIETAEEKDRFFITIKDTGIGIKAEDLPRVFEKGYTGYNGHADKKATGIGLYLCRQMADKLGHTIRMESELGKGTKVWIGFDLDYADTRD